MSDSGSNDERWMREALAEAVLAERRGEIPVGAVVVRGGVIIGRGHNRREARADPSAHAEMVALRQAARRQGDWRLSGCTLYVTLEPCPMCAGAIVLARIPLVVYGTADARAGAAGSLYDILRDGRLNHRCSVVRGVLERECAEILHRFFEGRRAEKRRR